MSLTVESRTRIPRRRPASTWLPSEISSIVWGRILFLLVPAIWFSGLAIGFVNALTILTFLSFGLFLLGIRWAGVGLIGLGMMTAIDPLTRGFVTTAIALPFNTINYLLLVSMVWFLPFLLRVNDVHSRLLQVLVLVLILMLYFSNSKINGVIHILNVVTLFGMLPYIARAIQNRPAMYWMGVISSLISAVGGIAFFLMMDSIGYLNPNAWAKFPVTGILLSCLAFPYAREFRLGRPTLLLLALVNALWVFLSGSRGNMLIGGVGLLFLIFYERNFSWKLFVFGLIVVAVTAMSAFFYEQQTYAVSRVEMLFSDDFDVDTATSGRLSIATRGLELFRRNPLGVGTGAFNSEIAAVSDFADSEIQAHSGWIKVLAENGIPGILLLGGYVFSFVVVGVRSGKREKVFFGTLATIVLAVAFISSEFQGKNLWFLAAAATVLLHDEQYAAIVAKATSIFSRREPRRVHAWRRPGG
ncbi:MAG TPA: O-antigen ligase family protein [Anaerolineaceae bacterium]|nr:O-antigen ligase family protein [Anaerolineaceae bacterium]